MENMPLIVADSSCDITPDIKESINIDIVPMRLDVLGQTFIDENLDISLLMQRVAQSKEAAKSACPPPHEFYEKFKKASQSFAVTLSSKLSGTYQSAIEGANMLLEEFKDKKVHVFDSKSASAGEVLIALKIHDLICLKTSFEEIVKKIESFIENMQTYFVLEDLNTLIKNGRMKKFVGIAVMALQIRPIMTSINGEIALAEKARGTKQALSRLANLVFEKSKDFTEKTLVIAHCNNEERALFFKSEIEKLCNFGKIIIVKTQGLSSIYANTGGIVIAY